MPADNPLGDDPAGGAALFYGYADCFYAVFFYDSQDFYDSAVDDVLVGADFDGLHVVVCGFAADHGVDLVVCVAAAQRRGIVDAHERERQGKDADNLAAGFRIAGLGQLIEAALDADRLVQFG